MRWIIISPGSLPSHGIFILETRNSPTSININPVISSNLPRIFSSIYDCDMFEATPRTFFYLYFSNKQSKSFINALRTKAQACKDLDEELVLAIDTDIGNLTLFAQELFTALGQLQEALAKEGLDNVRIVIGNGAEVETHLKKYLAEKGDKKNFVISAVVKSKSIAEDNQFKEIKDRIHITAVDDTNMENTNAEKANYIPILSILELSIKKAMGLSTGAIRDEYSNLQNIDDMLEQNGMLIIHLLPKSKPIPIDDLRERYQNEAQVLISA